MKRTVLICMAICAIYTKNLASEKDSIVYILPDRIEVKLDSIIAERKKATDLPYSKSKLEIGKSKGFEV